MLLSFISVVQSLQSSQTPGHDSDRRLMTALGLRSCVLTRCGDVSRDAGSRSGAVAGYTLVSSQRAVREGGDKQGVRLHHDAQLGLVAAGEQLASVQTPADMCFSGSGTASQGHAAT